MEHVCPGRFEGRTFVVTGGSSGIGRAAAERLAAEGGRVLITGRDASTLKDVADPSDRIESLVDDASDSDAGEALAERARSLFGSLDGAVLNAGFAELSRMTS